MRKTTIILVIIIGLFGKAEAQKGEKSIAAGILVAIPFNNISNSDNRIINSGVGMEAIGQYNFTEKSAALLQLQLTRFAGEKNYPDSNFSTSFISPSLKGGYWYQLNTAGFYANALAGVEQNSYGNLYTTASLGLGKRFSIRDIYFIDAGLDYITGINRVNIKGVFSLLRRPGNR